MTWQELADFINNKMPECNRNQDAVIWDSSVFNGTSGKFIDINGISPFDSDECASDDNFYSANVDSDGWYS